jgi:hypothetical protein
MTDLFSVLPANFNSGIEASCVNGDAERIHSMNYEIVFNSRIFLFGLRMDYLKLVGKINHCIFKALIFWEKVKALLGFENYDLLH